MTSPVRSSWRAPGARSVVVALLFAFALTTPFSTAAGSVLGVTLLAAGLATYAFHAPSRAAVPRVVLVAVVGFAVWTALATALADPYPVKWKPWANEMWIKLLALAIAALVSATRVRVDRLLHVYLGTATVVAVFGIWQHFTGTIPIDDDIPPMRGRFWEIEAFYNHHLTYGGHVVALWLLAVARPLLLGRAWRDGRSRWFTVLSVGLLSLALLWSYARSAQLAGVAGLLFLAIFLAPRQRMVVGAALALGVLAVLATPALREHFAKALDPSSEQTRLNLWRSSAHAIHANPWTGCGVGNFGEMLEQHQVPGTYNTTAHSHNDYLMHAVNAGLPALGFALLLIGGSLYVLVRARGGDGVTRWIVLGVASAQVALSTGGMLQVYQSDDEVEMTLYFLLGCALGHLASTRRDVESKP